MNYEYCLPAPPFFARFLLGRLYFFPSPGENHFYVSSGTNLACSHKNTGRLWSHDHSLPPNFARFGHLDTPAHPFFHLSFLLFWSTPSSASHRCMAFLCPSVSPMRGLDWWWVFLFIFGLLLHCDTFSPQPRIA
jgi:hypothetical protein